MAHVLAKPIQPKVINYMHVVYIVIEEVKEIAKIYLTLYTACTFT